MVKYLWVIFQCSARGLSHAISVGFYKSCSGKSSLWGPTESPVMCQEEHKRGWESVVGDLKCDKQAQNPPLPWAGRRGRVLQANHQDRGDEWAKNPRQSLLPLRYVQITQLGRNSAEQRVNWGHLPSQQPPKKPPKNSKREVGWGLFADKQHRALHKNNTEHFMWQTNK